VRERFRQNFGAPNYSQPSSYSPVPSAEDDAPDQDYGEDQEQTKRPASHKAHSRLELVLPVRLEVSVGMVRRTDYTPKGAGRQRCVSRHGLTRRRFGSPCFRGRIPATSPGRASAE